MSKNRINPRRLPATQADVDRAYSQGYMAGYKDSASMWVTVLLDKEGHTEADIQRIYDELCELADSIKRGYVKPSDLRNAAKFESHVNVHE